MRSTTSPTLRPWSVYTTTWIFSFSASGARESELRGCSRRSVKRGREVDEGQDLATVLDHVTAFRPFHAAASEFLQRATRERGMAVRPLSGPRSKRSDSLIVVMGLSLRSLFPHTPIANLGDDVGALS